MSGAVEDVPVRPAATLVLVREGRKGPEVLLLERTRHSAFVAGAHVFPGGALDPADDHPEIRSLCLPPSPDTLACNPPDDLAWRVAAIRESFEEAGILLARTAPGNLPQPPGAELEHWREALLSGRTTLTEICRQRGWQLDTGGLHYYSRWVTPPGQSRRYDTRFFITEAPPGQEGRACQRETVARNWLRPAEAIDRWHSRDISLVFPTAVTLQELADFDSASALLKMARKRQADNPDS